MIEPRAWEIEDGNGVAIARLARHIDINRVVAVKKTPLTTVADVLKATVMDIQDGCLRVTQGKTGAKLRIALEGRLGALVVALKPPRSAKTVVCTHLIRNEDEQPLTYSAMTQRFSKARELAMKAAVADEQSALAVSLKGFQFRDLRAKAASDLEDLARAQELLGHADRSMTQDYVRARIGDKVRPVK